MTMQTFSIAPLRKVRQYITKNLQVSEIDTLSPHFFDDDDDIPEPDSLNALGGIFNMGGVGDFDDDTAHTEPEGSWTISNMNPADVLYKFPGLQLKPKIRLVSFTFQHHTDGKGVVWAVPEQYCTTDYLERAVENAGGVKQPPHPSDAFADFMDAIEGDRSLVTFFVASILRREILEYGAKGQFQNWTHHRLIDTVPASIKSYWKSEHPQNLRPKINELSDGKVAIEFFTCRVVPPVMIVRHVDQYPAQNYSPKTTHQVLLKLKEKH